MVTDEDLHEGMAQLTEERHALALEHFTVAADAAADQAERRAAVAFAAQISLTLGRPYEAIAWAERLHELSDDGSEAGLLEASAWVALGDGAQALDLLEHAELPTSDYTTYPPSLLPQLRCQAHGLVGDVDVALAEAGTALGDDWALPEIWRAVARLADTHDVDVAEVTEQVPDDGLLQVLGWLLESPATGADRLVEALWQRFPGDMRILALVTSLGNRLPLERALEWSARLRAAGLGDECAVLGIAANGDRSPAERLRAAAVAETAFADVRSTALAEVAASDLPDDEVPGCLTELLEMGSDAVVDAFIVAAASTAPRSLVLARTLLDLGAQGAAVSLVRHAAELTGDEPAGLWTAAASSLDEATITSLAATLRSHQEGEVADLLMSG